MSTTTSFQRLHVSPLIPSDIPGIVTFNQAAWAHGVGDIFKRDIFQPYSTDSPEARAIYTEYYTHELSNNNPIEHYLKVVDTQIGPGNENGNRIIACGCWAVFKIDPWSEEARDGPEGKAIRQKVDAFWLEGREEWREKKRMAEHVFDFLVYASSQVEGLRRGHLREWTRLQHAQARSEQRECKALTGALWTIRPPPPVLGSKLPQDRRWQRDYEVGH